MFSKSLPSLPSLLWALLDPDEAAVAGDGEPLDGPPSDGRGGGGDWRRPGPVRRGRLPGAARGVGMHRRSHFAIARAAGRGSGREAPTRRVASARQSGGSQ